MTKTKIKQLRNRTFIFIILIIAIIGGLRTYDDLKRNNQILENKKQLIQKEIIHNYEKQIDGIESFLNIYGTHLSTSPKIQELFLKKDRETLYKHLQPMYKSFNAGNYIVNIVHFHNLDHSSFLRMHKKDKFGDNLKDIRPMITHAIKTKSKTIGYEHGKYDISQLMYRMVFPIFSKNDFLGVVEVGIDTSQIMSDIEGKIKDLFNNDVTIFHMINKGTKNYEEYENSYTQLDKYLYKPTEFINSILQDTQIIKEQQIIYNNRIYCFNVSKTPLQNYRGKNIGDHFHVLDVTDDIEKNKRFFYSSLAKPIVAAIVIIILVGWIFLYFYKNFLKIEKRTRNIIDAQSSLIVLSDGLNILDCNKALLDFYGFETLDEFKNAHMCICNTFEEGDQFLQKEQDRLFWITKLLDNKNEFLKVSIKNKNGEHNLFSIVLNQYGSIEETDEEYFVITLTNISSLEKANTQLIEQSKQASLGEMIGNIAHQWRQPLSAISSIASGVSLKTEFDKINNETVISSMDKIVHKTKYLSETIDTFRNFIKEEKTLKTVSLIERIEIAINIVSASLDSNHIKLTSNIDKVEKIELKLVLGELTQVLINLINNSKDAICENNIKGGFINLEVHDKETTVVILIEDNGGGISESIKDKIFEPYFTTKHKSLGTGLGLYMSYKIITESMKGTLKVSNTKKGAQFIIELPKL